MKAIINKESAADYLMSNLEICKTKEDIILVFWSYWVESVTLTALEYQKVLANAPVNKWFIAEFSKEEKEYRALISKYPDTRGRDKDWLWCKCVSKLMSRFPSALLEVAKKREEKAQTTKIAGIRIEMLIHNLN